METRPAAKGASRAGVRAQRLRVIHDPNPNDYTWAQVRSFFRVGPYLSVWSDMNLSREHGIPRHQPAAETANAPIVACAERANVVGISLSDFQTRTQGCF